MNKIHYPNNHYYSSPNNYINMNGKKSLPPFLLGAATISMSILFGRDYVFYIFFLLLSLFITFRWRDNPIKWIFFASIVSATPIAISQQQFTCNLILAFWLAIFNREYFNIIPKWIKVLTVLAFLGLFTSSINWLSSNVVQSTARQLTFAYNLLLPPFILLPFVYSRMMGSQNHTTNLHGLLFFLIFPSTLILISTKLFGTVANEWEAMQHGQSLAEGFLQYRLGRVIIKFLRTEVGFILAALICASTAITISSVKGYYKLVAGVCLMSNVYLMLVTASFGSGFSCICGLCAIFFKQFRNFNPMKAIGSLFVVICALILIYTFLPSNTKDYIGKRYEHRVTNADTDRIALWSRAIETILRHPEGVGFTLSVGEIEKTFFHNEYLAYTTSYGIIGGLAYTLLVIKLLFIFFKTGINPAEDPNANAVYLCGLGVVVAIAVNTMTDHLNANRWYFNVSWSIIWYCFFCSCVNPSPRHSEEPILTS